MNNAIVHQIAIFQEYLPQCYHLVAAPYNMLYQCCQLHWSSTSRLVRRHQRCHHLRTMHSCPDLTTTSNTHTNSKQVASSFECILQHCHIPTSIGWHQTLQHSYVLQSFLMFVTWMANRRDVFIHLCTGNGFGEQSATKAWIITYETEGVGEDKYNCKQVCDPWLCMLRHVLSAGPCFFLYQG